MGKTWDMGSDAGLVGWWVFSFLLFVSAYIVQCARLIFEIQTSKRQSTTRPARILRRRLFGPLDSTIILQMEVPTFGKKKHGKAPTLWLLQRHADNKSSLVSVTKIWCFVNKQYLVSVVGVKKLKANDCLADQ